MKFRSVSLCRMIELVQVYLCVVVVFVKKRHKVYMYLHIHIESFLLCMILHGKNGQQCFGPNFIGPYVTKLVVMAEMYPSYDQTVVKYTLYIGSLANLK